MPLRGPIKTSFDRFVGAGLEPGRDGKGERLRGLEIDDQIPFLRKHDRQILRLGPVKDTARISADFPIRILKAGRIAQQTAREDIVAPRINSRKRVPRGELSEEKAPIVVERITPTEQLTPPMLHL